MRQIITSVIISLERQAAEKDDPKAIGLLKLTSQWKFVATLHAMCDILPKLSELSRRFQVGGVERLLWILNVFLEHLAIPNLHHLSIVINNQYIQQFLNFSHLFHSQKKDLAYTDIQEKLSDTIEQLETALIVPGRFTRQRDYIIEKMTAAGINLKSPMDGDDFKLNVRWSFRITPTLLFRNWPSYGVQCSVKLFSKAALAGYGSGPKFYHSSLTNRIHSFSCSISIVCYPTLFLLCWAPSAMIFTPSTLSHKHYPYSTGLLKFILFSISDSWCIHQGSSWKSERQIPTSRTPWQL